jgi:hypothetical protein
MGPEACAVVGRNRNPAVAAHVATATHRDLASSLLGFVGMFWFMLPFPFCFGSVLLFWASLSGE